MNNVFNQTGQKVNNQVNVQFGINWQPINTSPKNKNIIILYVDSNYVTTGSHVDMGCWQDYDGEFIMEPDYWHPLETPKP